MEGQSGSGPQTSGFFFLLTFLCTLKSLMGKLLQKEMKLNPFLLIVLSRTL